MRPALPLSLASSFVALAVACGGSTSGVGPADGGADGSSGGSGTGTSGGPSPSDAGGVVSKDGAPVDAGNLFTALPGVWLIGWFGDLNHYSWVRLDAGGQAKFLSGSDLPGNAPYWSCAGDGTWVVSQKPSTIFLTFPASCGLPGKALTFDSFYAPTGSPKNAILGAHISEDPPNTPLDGWKFSPAASPCDAPMSTCANPF